MRIALLNIDSVASNQALRGFIERNSKEIAVLGLSPPFGKRRGGVFAQSVRHLRRSGLLVSSMLSYNFAVPRMVGQLAPRRTTLAGFAEARGIAVARIEDINERSTLDLLRRFDVDLIVSFYFDQIMGQEIIDLPRLGVINAHSSLLPMHRGPMPVLFSCLDGPPKLGMTIHSVDTDIDTGPILSQRTFVPPPRDSVLSLTRQLHQMGAEMLEELLPEIERGTLSPILQVGGSYESFPDRKAMRILRQCRRSLFDLSDVAVSLRTPMSI